MVMEHLAGPRSSAGDERDHHDHADDDDDGAVESGQAVVAGVALLGGGVTPRPVSHPVPPA